MQSFDLPLGGFSPRQIHHNVPRAALYEAAVRRNEGVLADSGALVVDTGKYTGRSPRDKFFVEDAFSRDRVHWGKVNQPISEAHFEGLFRKVAAYLADREVFVLDTFVGAEPAERLPVRVITELAWHSLFAQNMFLNTVEVPCDFAPGFTIISAPGCQADPATDGTASETFVVVSFEHRIVLIGGTYYAGEIKKSVFTLMNTLLPERGVLPMHCSANVGEQGDVAIFFGLSGTGKTTLSADPERRLIGDDEHGWGDEGVFNFEGGCYAKVIRLSAEAEPEIYAASHRFGTVLENVVIDPTTRTLDLDDARLTENTRSSYPLTFIPNAEPSGLGDHPLNVIMLTADAFGVMPPIARLTREQAMYHFLSGYTAKVAGTEKGLGKEPEATFSTCFGAPFMALDPAIYAKLLGEKIARHGVRCWLVNTGWNGGPFGVGKRISIAHTRALLHAALNGGLEGVPTVQDPVFGLHVPTRCPGVPTELLLPRNTWSDPGAYDRQAANLAARFHANIRQFEDRVPAEVLAAGPLAGAKVTVTFANDPSLHVKA